MQTYKQCQCCGMPLKKDLNGGGTEKEVYKKQIRALPYTLVLMSIFVGFLFNITASIIYDSYVKSDTSLKVYFPIMTLLLSLGIFFSIKRPYLDPITKAKRKVIKGKHKRDLTRHNIKSI